MIASLAPGNFCQRRGIREGGGGAEPGAQRRPGQDVPVVEHVSLPFAPGGLPGRQTRPGMISTLRPAYLAWSIWETLLVLTSNWTVTLSPTLIWIEL